MLVLDISANVLPIAGLVFAAFLGGFILRSAQLKSLRRKVLELEKEMLSNHADILELQKERADLIRQMKESKIPVISITKAKDDGDQSRHAK